MLRKPVVRLVRFNMSERVSQYNLSVSSTIKTHIGVRIGVDTNVIHPIIWVASGRDY